MQAPSNTARIIAPASSAALRHSLDGALQHLRERPGAATARLHRLRVPTPAMDPWDLLEWALSCQDNVFAWSDESSGMHFLAAGAAAVLEGDAVWRPDACLRLREQVSRVESPRDEAPAPMVLEGLGFPLPGIERPGGPWAGWPTARAYVPRWLLLRCAERTELVLHLPARGVDAGVRGLLEALAKAPPERPPTAAPAQLRWEDSESEEAWCHRVQSARMAIGDARFEKVVMARAAIGRVAGAARLDAAASARALRQRAGGYAFLVQGPGGSSFIGASPERLLSLEGRSLHTDAIAGTARREAGLGQALRRSDKDLREHGFVVQAIAAALNPLCSELSVDATPELLELPGLQHLRTRLRAELSAPLDAHALALRLHPTPAVGSWPREPGLAWLQGTEALSRGWYAGALGWVDGQGSGTLAVGIRSALLRPREAWCFAGAGIVAGSDPESEWRETRLKLRTAQSALATAACEEA